MSYLSKIISIRPVTHDVRCIRLQKPQKYSFVPGQATDVSINKPGWKDKKNPFTFTGFNDDPFLQFTIKGYPERHGVTEQLHQLKQGDEIIVRDVWGAIEYAGPGVFLAGGAGITPFLAIFRQLHRDHKARGNTLYFSNKTVADIIEHQELLDILRKVLPQAPQGTQHPSASTQHDRDSWPELQRYFSACFAQLPRSEWERHFMRTDARTVPVLTRDEAALSGVLPAATADNVADGNPVIPSPAPRLTRTPARPPAGSAGGEWETEGAEMLLTPGEHTDDILLELGISDPQQRINLYRSDAIDGPDRPEGLVKSKL